MMKKLVASIALVIMITGLTWGEIPGKINIQGRLVDSSGSPPTSGEYEMSVTFNKSPHDVPGNQVWKSSASLVFIDENGFFSAEFAGGDPSLSNVPFDISYYVEFFINPPGESIPHPVSMANPRLPLFTAPYAFTAKNVEGGKVNAIGDENVAVWGRSSSNKGVAGISRTGTGVYGYSGPPEISSPAPPAEEAVGEEAATGVTGTLPIPEEVKGHGVYGKTGAGNKAGVYGTGITFGGYFTASKGSAVKGESSAKAGFGVNGEVTGEDGIGTYGKSTNLTGVGVKAENTEPGGIALEVQGALKTGIRELRALVDGGEWIEGGKIKMVDFGIDPAGIIHITEDCIEISVRTKAVKDRGALILITKQTGTKSINLNARAQGPGVFSITRPLWDSSQTIPGDIDMRIGFLVIN
ncbi:MAG: hypothetical protein ABID35_00205 [Candidatus Margulisiibacteriota bacterium]